MSEIHTKVYGNIGGKTLAVVFAFSAVGLMVFCQLAVFTGAALLGIDSDRFDGALTTLYSIITIVVLFLFIKILSYKREPLLKTGKLNGIQMVLVVFVAFALMGLVNLYLIAAGLIAEQFPEFFGVELEKYSESVNRYAEYEPVVIPEWDHILEFIGVAFLVPLAEELTFRGAVLGALLKNYRPSVAILMSACIFGLLHGLSIHIGYALLCGIVIGWVYYYTESIRATYLLHALFNLMGSSVTTLLKSGLFGDATELSKNFMYLSYNVEFMAIIPGIASFIFLGMIYKEKAKATVPELVPMPEDSSETENETAEESVEETDEQT